MTNRPSSVMMMRSSSDQVKRSAGVFNGRNSRRNTLYVKSGSAMSTTAKAASFFDFGAVTLGSGTRDSPVEGDKVDFSKYAGKVVFVQNIATL